MASLSNNGILTFCRGDTVEFPLVINIGSKLQPIRYSLSENDALYVAILEPNQPFEFALVKQKYTYLDKNEYGDVVFKLSSDVTQQLKPGRYYYEVKLVKQKENQDLAKQNDNQEELEVVTVIDRRQLYILN